MTKSRTLWGDLKKKAKNNYLVVAFLAALAITTFVATIISNVETIYSYINKREDIFLSIEGDTDEYISEYEYLKVPLRVTWIKNDRAAVSEAEGVVRVLRERKDSSFYKLKEKTIELPSLYTESKSKKLVDSIRIRDKGIYKLEIFAEQEGYRISNTVSVPVKVTRYDYQSIADSLSNYIPTFVVKNKTADVAPSLLSDMARFMIIVPHESEQTNIKKSTVLIGSDYIGALGGLHRTISINRCSLKNFEEKLGSEEFVFRKSCYKKIDRLIRYSGSVVPIGDQLYSLSIQDAQRMKVKRVSQKCRKIDSQRIEPTSNKKPEWRYLEIKSYSLKFKTTESCGATGRNCFFKVDVGGSEYYNRWKDESGLTYNDFPLYLRADENERVLDRKNSPEYLKISTGPGSVNVSKCTVE